MTLEEMPTDGLLQLLERYEKRAKSLFYNVPVSSPQYSKHQKQWADKDYYDNSVWIHNIEHILKSRGYTYDKTSRTFIPPKD